MRTLRRLHFGRRRQQCRVRRLGLPLAGTHGGDGVGIYVITSRSPGVHAAVENRNLLLRHAKYLQFPGEERRLLQRGGVVAGRHDHNGLARLQLHGLHGFLKLLGCGQHEVDRLAVDHMLLSQAPEVDRQRVRNMPAHLFEHFLPIDRGVLGIVGERAQAVADIDDLHLLRVVVQPGRRHQRARQHSRLRGTRHRSEREQPRSYPPLGQTPSSDFHSTPPVVMMIGVPIIRRSSAAKTGISLADGYRIYG